MDLAKPNLKTLVCNLRSMILAVVRPNTKSSFFSDSRSKPRRTMRRSRASPWKIRIGLLSSRVSRVRAAVRILAKAYCTRHTSRLFFKPYSPMIFISPSRRSFSKGLLGLRKVLP
eukprot:Skav229907  [mRNA]  locus=scaffold2151:506954:508405:+ [translate_table: standard]